MQKTHLYKSISVIQIYFDENSCKLGWKENVPNLIKPYNKKHLSER